MDNSFASLNYSVNAIPKKQIFRTQTYSFSNIDQFENNQYYHSPSLTFKVQNNIQKNLKKRSKS